MTGWSLAIDTAFFGARTGGARRHRVLLAAARWLAALLVLAAGGCATVRVTEPGHSATELFLMSQAADKAADQLATAPLRDRKVYVDTTYFHAQMQEGYALGDIRAHLLQNGVRLVDKRGEAQIILEVRSGGIGIDRYNYLLGIPPIFLPATGTSSAVGNAALGSVVTPEIAIFKSIRQKGYARLAYVAYWRDTGEVVASSGPFVGRTEREDWWFFGVGPNTTGNVATTDKSP